MAIQSCNSQYPGYTWRHLVHSVLSCHIVLGSTCRFLPHTVKSFHTFHTKKHGRTSFLLGCDGPSLDSQSIPCLNLFKISRKTLPFLCSLSVLLVSNTNMVGHVELIPRMHCLGDYCATWCYTNRLSRVLRIVVTKKKQVYKPNHPTPSAKNIFGIYRSFYTIYACHLIFSAVYHIYNCLLSNDVHVDRVLLYSHKKHYQYAHNVLSEQIIS